MKLVFNKISSHNCSCLESDMFTFNFLLMDFGIAYVLHTNIVTDRLYRLDMEFHDRWCEIVLPIVFNGHPIGS